jgi:uncharacterized protein
VLSVTYKAHTTEHLYPHAIYNFFERRHVSTLEDMSSLFKRLHAALYPPPPAPVIATTRKDGWENAWTGIGTSRDKSMAGMYMPKYQLPHNELIAMFNGSDLAKKIVQKPVKEMFRRGYDIKADDVDADEQKELETKLADLRLNYIFCQTKIWGRLFGGALILMGAVDGQTVDQPLNEDNITSFEFLNAVDRRYVWVQSYYNDPMSPKYGMPERYLVTNMISGAGFAPSSQTKPGESIMVIHETRVIRFDGNETDDLTRQQLAGWTFSVLQTVYDTLKKFEHAFDSCGALMSDASQAVFKMQGLIDAITSGNVQDIQSRMSLVDMSRSSIKAVLLDAGNGTPGSGESFNREPTSFAGLSDLLNVWMARLAAAADMPRTELFGESPGGLGSNGDGETRKWYDMIASLQKDELGPLLKRVINLISKAGDSPISNAKDVDWEIDFKPLWEPTDKEEAEYRLSVAQADAIYLTNGVITPEQCALGRWGGSVFSPDVEVDVKELQSAIDGKTMTDPYANEPPPDDPTLAGAPLTGQGASPLSPLPITKGPSPGKQAVVKPTKPVKPAPKKP